MVVELLRRVGEGSAWWSSWETQPASAAGAVRGGDEVGGEQNAVLGWAEHQRNRVTIIGRCHTAGVTSGATHSVASVSACCAGRPRQSVAAQLLPSEVWPHVASSVSCG